VRRSSLRDVRAAVVNASRRATDPLELERAVAEQVRRVVPFDLWCGLTTDPTTGNPTGGFHDEGLPKQRLPRLVDIEHGADGDVATLRTLAHDPVPVTTLSAATEGDLARSARYRDVLAPSGIRHEIRALFRGDSGAWGALVLMRGGDEHDFSAAEADLLRSLSRVVADGLRRATVLASAPGDVADGPGLLLCTVTDCIRVDHATQNARRWLSEIDDGRQDETLPYAVASLVYSARWHGPGSPQRRARLRTRSGRWLSLHAAALDGGTVSVVLEPSPARDVAALLLDAMRLSAREREVALLAVRGLSNADIAEALFLSPHTVNDHLKSVFSKAGVGGRRELAAKLIFDHVGDLAL
jgi:DNA-binding CsgD family transcriptional regulator